MQVSHPNVELKLDDWRDALESTLASATQTLEEELLFDLGEAPQYPIQNLTDTASDMVPGHSFLDDPRNQLHAVRDWLFHRVRADPKLASRFFKKTASSTVSSDDTPIPFLVRQSAVNDYLHTNQQFLRQLATLMYWGSGLPPRRKELVGISWCTQETARNLYIHDGSVVMVTGYHKSEWRVGTRPVARFLLPAVGELLVRYLIYLPPFLRYLKDCMQQPLDRGFLFCDGNEVWTTDRLGNAIKRQSTLLIGFPINTRQWRHIAICLDRRILLGIGCRTYGVSESWEKHGLHAVDGSASELDPEMDQGDNLGGTSNPLAAIHHMQASHTSGTNTTTYGNDLSLHAGLTDSLLAAYGTVSQGWQQQVIGRLKLLSTASSYVRTAKRDCDTNPSEVQQLRKRIKRGSSVLVRRELWKWPIIFEGLKALFGPHATVRSQAQRDALTLVARSRPETLIVMPTGSGKSILFVVPSQLLGAHVTIVIVPLIALKQDLLRRCREWGIACLCYDPASTPSQLHAVPALLLVDIETAVTSSFLAFVQNLHAVGRVDRLVLDEAHLLLTASHYRESIGAIGMLRKIRCPFVCMTATLPPSAEAEVRRILNFTRPECRRESSDRPNLEYCVQLLEPPMKKQPREDTLFHAVTAVCEQDISGWKESGNTTARGICYVRNRDSGGRIAAVLKCHFYHGLLAHSERQEVMTAWSLGQGSPFIVATAAFSAGVDHPSVRRVLHAGPPDGLLNYGQETGRAGRDGLPAVCLILLAEGWQVSWDSTYHSDFLTEDRMQMAQFLQSRQCLRQHLTVYLDGPPGVACSQLGQGTQTRMLCSSCRSHRPLAANLGTPSTVTYPESEESDPVANPSTQLDTRLHAAPTTVQTVARLHAVGLVDTDTQLDAQSIVSSPESSWASSSLEQLPDDSEPEGSLEENHQDSDLAVYDVAHRLACSQAMEDEEGRQLYEQRVAIWGRACILCSFGRRQLVEGSHSDCMQNDPRYVSSLNRLRHSIKFAAYSACFRCGQPSFICDRRRQRGCMQPWLIYHSSWTALWLDQSYGAQMVTLLGGPDLTDKLDQKAFLYYKWLGEKAPLFGLEGSNAARLLHVWLDRLEAHCFSTARSR